MVGVRALTIGLVLVCMRRWSSGWPLVIAVTWCHHTKTAHFLYHPRQSHANISWPKFVRYESTLACHWACSLSLSSNAKVLYNYDRPAGPRGRPGSQGHDLTSSTQPLMTSHADETQPRSYNHHLTSIEVHLLSG